MRNKKIQDLQTLLAIAYLRGIKDGAETMITEDTSSINSEHAMVVAKALMDEEDKAVLTNNLIS